MRHIPAREAGTPWTRTEGTILFATVQSLWDFQASQHRPAGFRRHPGFLAALGLSSLSALLDAGLRRNDESQASVNINFGPYSCFVQLARKLALKLY